MTHFHKRPTLPTNPAVMRGFDALWRNFGMPKFPKISPLLDDQTNQAVKTLDDYLDVVRDVLERTERNVAQAATLFRDVPAEQFPDAHAFTLALSRKTSAGEPPVSQTWPDGIYFNPRYLKSESGNAVGH